MNMAHTLLAATRSECLCCTQRTWKNTVYAEGGRPEDTMEIVVETLIVQCVIYSLQRPLGPST